MLRRDPHRRAEDGIVRRLWATISLVAAVAAIALAAGCVDSSEEAAQTPSNAPTVVNSAAQTDSEGNFVTAPPSTSPPGGGATPGGATTGGDDAAGDAAEGQQVFATNCTACHLNNGQDAGGVGPQLAGRGLTEDIIRTTVENGRGAMPPGLVSGGDLDDVAAYVLSLQ
jgi:cytochrome c551